MKYSFKPAGFDPPPRQREYRQKTNELEKKLELWLHKFEKTSSYAQDYQIAQKQFRNTSSFSLDEAHAAVIAHQDYNGIESAGYWLSAAYNKSEETVIRYDLALEDRALDGLGYHLHKDKTLVNVGTAGDWMGGDAKGAVVNVGRAGNDMGWNAKGTVVNVGRAGNYMGWNAKGTVVNVGRAGNYMGWNAKGTVVIALKDPKSYGDLSEATVVLKEKDCKKIPELKEYLESMRKAFEDLRNAPVEHIQEVMKEWNQKNIEVEIQEILRRGGYRS